MDADILLFVYVLHGHGLRMSVNDNDDYILADYLYATGDYFNKLLLNSMW